MKNIIAALVLTVFISSAAFAQTLQHFQNDTQFLERITDGLGITTELQPGDGIDLDPANGPYTIVYVAVKAGGL